MLESDLREKLRAMNAKFFYRLSNNRRTETLDLGLLEHVWKWFGTGLRLSMFQTTAMCNAVRRVSELRKRINLLGQKLLDPLLHGSSTHKRRTVVDDSDLVAVDVMDKELDDALADINRLRIELIVTGGHGQKVPLQTTVHNFYAADESVVKQNHTERDKKTAPVNGASWLSDIWGVYVASLGEPVFAMTPEEWVRSVYAAIRTGDLSPNEASKITDVLRLNFGSCKHHQSTHFNDYLCKNTIVVPHAMKKKLKLDLRGSIATSRSSTNHEAVTVTSSSPSSPADSVAKNTKKRRFPVASEFKSDDLSQTTKRSRLLAPPSGFITPAVSSSHLSSSSVSSSLRPMTTPASITVLPQQPKLPPASELCRWLAKLGAAYAGYADTFLANGVTMEFLKEVPVTVDDLKDLQLKTILHAKKIVFEANKLRRQS
jgi:hypothetical protein